MEHSSVDELSAHQMDPSARFLHSAQLQKPHRLVYVHMSDVCVCI